MSEHDELLYQQYYNSLLQSENSIHRAQWGKNNFPLKPIKIQFDREELTSFREMPEVNRQRKPFDQNRFSEAKQQNRHTQKTRSHRKIDSKKINGKSSHYILELSIANPQRKIELLRKELKEMRRNNQSFLKKQDNTIQQKIRNKIKGIQLSARVTEKIKSFDQLNTITEDCPEHLQKYSHERQLKNIKNGINIKRWRPLILSRTPQNIHDRQSSVGSQRGETNQTHFRMTKYKGKERKKCFTVGRESPNNKEDMPMRLFLLGRLNPLKNVLEYVKYNQKVKSLSKLSKKHEKNGQSHPFKVSELIRKRSSLKLEQLPNSNDFRSLQRQKDSLFEPLLKRKRSSIISCLISSGANQYPQQIMQKSTERSSEDTKKNKRVMREGQTKSTHKDEYQSPQLRKQTKKRRKKIVLSFTNRQVDRQQQYNHSLIENDYQPQKNQQNEFNLRREFDVKVDYTSIF